MILIIILLFYLYSLYLKQVFKIAYLEQKLKNRNIEFMFDDRLPTFKEMKNL